MAKYVENANEQEIEVLEGIIEHIIYANEENGYTILEFTTLKNELITAVGVMPYVGEGENLKVYGKWVHNVKYGRQFSVSSYEKVMPADATSILRYLASGAIKGIGPKTAQRIVDTYGEDTFDGIWSLCFPLLALLRRRSSFSLRLTSALLRAVLTSRV